MGEAEDWAEALEEIRKNPEKYVKKGCSRKYTKPKLKDRFDDPDYREMMDFDLV